MRGAGGARAAEAAIRRLIPSPPSAGSDPRPALLSVIALMFLLLPCLLLTTSASRLVGLDLLLAGVGELPPDPSGVLESVQVELRTGELVVRAQVRRSDVTSGAGEVQLRERRLPAGAEGPDLAGLQAELRALKQLDPQRRRAELLPEDGVPAQVLVLVMDAARQDGAGALFPEVALGALPAGATP